MDYEENKLEGIVSRQFRISMPLTTSAKSSAKWTGELDAELISLYALAASKPDLVASGGKSLKAKAWK